MTKDEPRLLAQKEEIRRVLDSLGWTLEQLADKIVLKPETLRKYAGGHQPASPRVMAVISALAPKRHAVTDGPRGRLRQALEMAHLTPAALAKRIGYQIGVVQAVVEGAARIKEDMAEKIEELDIGLTAEELMEGSETPRVLHEGGAFSTVGSKPEILSLGAGRVRMIPLISMAQAGPHINFDDEIFQHEAIAVMDVKDPKAIALKVRGNSMEPEIKAGDVAVVCPSWTPRNGDEVICRTLDGDVMCKIYQAKAGGDFVILSSYNPAHPPTELRREDIAWIYPIQSVIKTRRRD
jgi:phage repressor protein C with HTH and peptisase S24 domain